MKLSKISKDKKAAIEMSITTIIVIVLGVTLLILGLAWIRNLFGKIGGLTEEAFRVAEQEIQERMATDQKFYIPGTEFEVKIGKEKKYEENIRAIMERIVTLSVPVVVVPQRGAGAEQEPSEIQLQAPPLLLQELPQLSVPVVLVPQAGAGAEQEPSGTQAAQEVPDTPAYQSGKPP